ncbi:hypothetical protein SNEBB_001760 [Seison nebaliae]|nr:hypothetical protein SNEBB_001760 [Seison nebaliae]
MPKINVRLTSERDRIRTWNLLNTTTFALGDNEKTKKLLEFFKESGNMKELIDYILGIGQMEVGSDGVYSSPKKSDENSQKMLMCTNASKVLLDGRLRIHQLILSDEEVMTVITRGLLVKDVKHYFYSIYANILKYFVSKFPLTMFYFWFRDIIHEGDANRLFNTFIDGNKLNEEQPWRFVKLKVVDLGEENVLTLLVLHLDKIATVEFELTLAFWNELKVMEKFLFLIDQKENKNFDFSLARSIVLLLTNIIQHERERMLKKMSRRLVKVSDDVFRHLVRFVPFTRLGELLQSAEFFRKLLKILVENKNELMTVQCIITIFLTVSTNQISKAHSKEINSTTTTRPHTHLTEEESKEQIHRNICLHSIINLMKTVNLEHMRILVDIMNRNLPTAPNYQCDDALAHLSQDIQTVLINLTLPLDQFCLISRANVDRDRIHARCHSESQYRCQYAFEDWTHVVDISRSYNQNLFLSPFIPSLFKLASVTRKTYYQKNIFRLFDYIVFGPIIAGFFPSNDKQGKSHQKLSTLFTWTRHSLEDYSICRLDAIQFFFIKKLFQQLNCTHEILKIYEDNSFSKQNIFHFTYLNKLFLIVDWLFNLTHAVVHHTEFERSYIQRFLKFEIVQSMTKEQRSKWEKFRDEYSDIFYKRIFGELNNFNWKKPPVKIVPITSTSISNSKNEEKKNDPIKNYWDAILPSTDENELNCNHFWKRLTFPKNDK